MDYHVLIRLYSLHCLTYSSEEDDDASDTDDDESSSSSLEYSSSASSSAPSPVFLRSNFPSSCWRCLNSRSISSISSGINKSLGRGIFCCFGCCFCAPSHSLGTCRRTTAISIGGTRPHQIGRFAKCGVAFGCCAGCAYGGIGKGASIIVNVGIPLSSCGSRSARGSEQGCWRLAGYGNVAKWGNAIVYVIVWLGLALAIW